MTTLKLLQPTFKFGELMSKVELHEAGQEKETLGSVSAENLRQLKEKALSLVKDLRDLEADGSWSELMEVSAAISLKSARPQVPGDHSRAFMWKPLTEFRTGDDLAALLNNHFAAAALPEYCASWGEDAHDPSNGYWRVQIGYDDEGDQRVALYTSHGEWVSAFRTDGEEGADSWSPIGINSLTAFQPTKDKPSFNTHLESLGLSEYKIS